MDNAGGIPTTTKQFLFLRDLFYNIAWTLGYGKRKKLEIPFKEKYYFE